MKYEGDSQIVIPANARIQARGMDSRVRGNDNCRFLEGRFSAVACRALLFSLIFILQTSQFILFARAQEIGITLTDPHLGLLRTDSANWSEAWIELDGAPPLSKKLTIDDLRVLNGKRLGKILSIDSVVTTFKSHLALSFVLDNSGSMFHAYDSLTRMCDTLVDSLPPGVVGQAVTFDNMPRSESHLYTRRSSVFIAQSGFRDSIRGVKSFWHFFDSIRTSYTPLYDAIAAAVGNVTSRRLNGDTTHADIVLVVTDGEDNASRTDIETLNDLLKAARVRLFAINFRTDADARLQWLARHTSGEYYLAYDIPDLADLLHQIRRRMSQQYHVRYQFNSPGPSSGR